MNIIIVGCGRVGRTLTEQLSSEGHDVTVIDENSERVQSVSADNDVMGVIGNGASHSVLMDAGIEEADLFIAVTDSDELNLLCCLLAKKAGNCATIARVRNPVYNQESEFIKKELGMSMIINPELAAATEMSRVLRFPKAMEINPFGKGRVEMLKFRIPSGSVLHEMSLIDLNSRIDSNLLVCAVERGSEVVIPTGSFRLREKDKVTIITAPENEAAFFRKIGIDTRQVKDAMIVGGGRMSYYLAKQLIAMGIQVKIIEQDRARCEELCLLLPQATIINGDGTDQDLLMEEGLKRAEGFVALTGLDEENILLSLFAKNNSSAKLVTKVKRINFNDVIDTLDLDTVVYPQLVTAEHIIRYVRARQNADGSNIETLYKIIEDKAEAMEFVIREESEVTGQTLEKLQLRRNILLCCITRKGQIIIPKGQDSIMKGDHVIVVAANSARLKDIKDILKRD